MIRSLIREEKGQGMVEYALIIALIAIVVLGALEALGGQVSKVFQGIKKSLKDST
ncbi:MAG TPA: Flp family type IVb pilin [Firmicutes bacterium]|nr:Flp family type IVb pilin [Candidatus Fermentithermobacillaceae bacterium]